MTYEKKSWIFRGGNKTIWMVATQGFKNKQDHHRGSLRVYFFSSNYISVGISCSTGKKTFCVRKENILHKSHHFGSSVIQVTIVSNSSVYGSYNKPNNMHKNTSHLKLSESSPNLPNNISYQPNHLVRK